MKQQNISVTVFSSTKFLLFGLLVLLCTSCYQDVIDLDLSEIERQIVIVGRIEEGSTNNYIEIARTSDLSGTTEIEKVNNAVVTVTDNFGNSETLLEQTAGRYKSTTIIGEENRTYTLDILSEGKEYTAVSQMPHAIDLESIEFQRLSEYDIAYELSISFGDQAGVPDYAMIKLYRNNILQKIDFYQDKYTDGNLITMDDFKVKFYPHDDVTIKVISLDITAYRYFTMLLDEEETTDDQNANSVDYSDLILSPNFNPRSNISNNALGYFSAQVIRTYRTSVQQ